MSQINESNINLSNEFINISLEEYNKLISYVTKNKERQKKATAEYSKNNREYYNDLAKKYYQRNKSDPEFKKKIYARNEEQRQKVKNTSEYIEKRRLIAKAYYQKKNGLLNSSVPMELDFINLDSNESDGVLQC
jgi:hypothetical protein